MSPASGSSDAGNDNIDNDAPQRPPSALKKSGNAPKRPRLPAPRPLGGETLGSSETETRQAYTSFAEPPQRTQSTLSMAAESVRSAMTATFVSQSTGNEYDVLSTMLIVTLMLISGTCNTILNKLQDQTCVENCSDPDPKNHKTFEQPLWQTLNMFLGEWLCLVIIYAAKAFSGFRGWRKSLYRTYYGSMPAELDIDEDILATPSTPAPRPAYPAAATLKGNAARPPLLKITRPGSSTIRPITAADEDYATPTVPHREEEILISQHDEDEEPVRVGAVGKTPQVIITDVDDRFEELHGWKVLLFMVPTACDIVGTTLMNVGLLYTTASIYQMLRGSVVLCTGVLSFFFLRRQLYSFQWIALLVIVLGIGIVGASPLLEDHQPSQGYLWVSQNPERDLAGTFMILLAQVFTSSQFIIEEKMLSRYHLQPMEAIGYEGTFGLAFLFLLAPPLYFWLGQGNPDSWFNIPVAWSQILSSPAIWGAGIGCVFSIAAFNGSGLEVTKRLTATSRSTVDACRTILIWGVSMALGWESFRILQVCGFVVLIYGTFTFNGIIPPPKFLAPRVELPEGDKQPLLNEDGEAEERR